jgi:hypothetical protein
MPLPKRLIEVDQARLSRRSRLDMPVARVVVQQGWNVQGLATQLLQDTPRGSRRLYLPCHASAFLLDMGEFRLLIFPPKAGLSNNPGLPAPTYSVPRIVSMDRRLY